MRRPSVRIDTLGGFSITVAGRALPVGRKEPLRPLALLKYLAAHAGRPLRDDQVSRALWPGREAADGALAVTLHRLRRLLGVPEAIMHRQGRIAIDMRHVWCDAAAFDAMLDRSERCARAERRRAMVSRALALYQGDFLAGEPRSAWVIAARARLRARYRAARAESVSDL